MFHPISNYQTIESILQLKFDGLIIVWVCRSNFYMNQKKIFQSFIFLTDIGGIKVNIFFNILISIMFLVRPLPTSKHFAYFL